MTRLLLLSCLSLLPLALSLASPELGLFQDLLATAGGTRTASRDLFILHYSTFQRARRSRAQAARRSQAQAARRKTAWQLERLVELAGRKTRASLQGLQVGFCPGSPRPVSLDLASVSPFPVVVAAGAEVSLTAQATLHQTVPEGVTASVRVKKHETWLPNIPLPCVHVHGLPLGSCDYSLAWLLQQAAPHVRPGQLPPGQQCRLPLLPGVYGSSSPQSLGPIPALPTVLADLFPAGEYDTEVTLRSEQGEELVCVYVKLKIRGPHTKQ